MAITAENRTSASVEHRKDADDHPSIAGVTVREDDIESDKAIRAIARLFRGMAILMVLLMIVQVISAVTGTVPVSFGVVVANAIRLIIFAGLLWGAGDIAVFFVKSHYDVRATRILTARLEHTVKQLVAVQAKIPAEGASPRADRAP